MARNVKELIGDAAAEWSREIERRTREVDDGTVELIDWEDVRAELFADESS